MPTGCGLAPCGFVSCGFWEDDTAPVRVANIVNARDITTGDFALDSDGKFIGMGKVRQMVVMALATIKGSATALPSLGLTFPINQNINSGTTRRIQSDVRSALAHLVRRYIRIVEIAVTYPTSSRAQVEVRYINLESNSEETVLTTNN